MKDEVPGAKYRFAEFELDMRRHVLLKTGRAVSINAKSFELLALLVTRAGQVLSKDELLEQVWPGQVVEENNLTVQISALRKLLGERKDAPRLILTIPGTGYKFIAEVQTPWDAGTEIVIENRTVSRVVVEHETEPDTPWENDGGDPRWTGQRPSTEPRAIAEPSPTERWRRPPVAAIYLGVGAILLVGLAAMWWWRSTVHAPTGSPLVRKLTTNGKVGAASLTPDGKYAVFAQTETDGESLWLRHIVTGSQTKILATQQVEFIGLAVSPDGNLVYATVFLENRADPELWRMPLLGGVTERVAGVVTGVAVSFSPDGKRMAFTESHSGLGETHLDVADADGGNKKTLVRAVDGQRSFSTFAANPVAWSPDGSRIACAIEETNPGGGMKTGVILVDPLTGTERFINDRRWDFVSHLVWSGVHDLALISQSGDPWQSQIWKISEITGEARPLTNDLNNYAWLSASANGDLLTVQQNAVSHLSVAEFDERARTLLPREIHNESGVIDNTAWALDGAVLFSSSATGRREIWRINADGTQPVQLSVGANITFGLAVSPIDGSLAFCSTTDGKHSLRIADAAGQNIRPLSDGGQDVWVNFAPDGQSVVFQRGLNNQTVTLWRTSVNGGPPVQLTHIPTLQPAVSPDGEKIAYYFMDQEADDAWRIGLVSSKLGTFLGKISFPQPVTARRMRWHPSGKFLSQVVYQGDIVNLLMLPTDESPAFTVSGLGPGSVNWFEWTRDGRRLVVSQTTQTQDAVLLSGF